MHKNTIVTKDIELQNDTSFNNINNINISDNNQNTIKNRKDKAEKALTEYLKRYLNGKSVQEQKHILYKLAGDNKVCDKF